jgi:hypothetical protein
MTIGEAVTVLAYAKPDEMTKLFYDTIIDLHGKE